MTSTPTARHRGEPDVPLGDEPGWAVTVDQDRSASLLVRVWLESGTDEFRARITSLDTSPGGEGPGELTVGVASSPREVITVVGTWLAEFLGTRSGTGPDPA
jgi:hypothetical protein